METVMETARLAEWKAIAAKMSGPELALLSILFDQADEAGEVHALARRAAGIVDHEAAAEAKRMRDKLRPYAQVSTLTGKRQACALFDGLLALEADEIREKIGGRIAQVRPDWSIGPVRVDRALWLDSGALVLVNVMEVVLQPSALASVGDAARYAVRAGLETTGGAIRPALAVPGIEDPEVAGACERAGVIYIPLGDVGFHRLFSQVLKMIITGSPEQ